MVHLSEEHNTSHVVLPELESMASIFVVPMWKTSEVMLLDLVVGQKMSVEFHLLDLSLLLYLSQFLGLLLGFATKHVKFKTRRNWSP